MFKRVPGTRDILPDQIKQWQKIEQVSRRVFSLYNYLEIRPPLIEESSLYQRSLGDATEIVQKQMFLIQKGEDSYALRPEGTASIVRAYIENNLDKTGNLFKSYYMGPMFRMERPQKGRYRQFHHIGCEVIGSRSPELDVEIIALADQLLCSYPVKGYSIVINSLGCADDKKRLTAQLREKLQNSLSDLCDDCKVRFEQNVLRILDCKNEKCKEIVQKLEMRDGHLCDPCRGHFETVKAGLASLNVKFEVSSNLVRGLDYYTGTVFEIKHDNLGPQQDALGAGGRYDNLVSELGGPQTGAIGFAFGVERLILASESPLTDAEPEKLVYLISLGDTAKKQGVIVLNTLRNAGIPADTDYEGKSLKGAMRKANDLKAPFTLILGDNELQKNTIVVKNMGNGEQKEISMTDLVKYLSA